MWLCKRLLLLNYFKYASRHLVSRFYYFVFLLADSPYFCLQEVTSSQAMEKEAFIRCINNIHHLQNPSIKMLSTDRHVSIKKLMKTDERFNISNVNSIRGMLPKEYLKKMWSLRQPKVGIIYQYLIPFMLGGNKKLCMLKQTCSWKLLLKYLLLFTTTRHWLTYIYCSLVGVIGTSRNMTFAFIMIFIFYPEKIRRILKFPFSLFVAYFNLKLLFWYIFM